MWAWKARAWRNHADGGGVRFRIDSKCFWKTKMNVLIMYCSSYNASQLPPMYRCKWMQVSWCPFPLPHRGKDKHQERNNKINAKLLYRKDWILIDIKGYAKPIEHQLKAHMEYHGKNKEVIYPNGKNQWCLWM